jgi:nucleotide-binding universal stress UspA family protein
MDTAQEVPRIVVAVDGSPPSVQALRWARTLAGCTGAAVEAVTVWTYPAAAGWGMVGGWDPEQNAKAVVEEALDAAYGEERPADLTARVLQGPPAKTLLDASEGAQMLVMGSRGHGGFAGLLLGSVSAVCAEHAHVPVLVVHGGGAPA